MAFVRLLVTGEALSEVEGSTTVDLNAVTNLILPIAAPTADGEVAVDITPPVEFAQDVLTWWGGTDIQTAVALAAAEMPSAGAEDGFHVAYNATNNEFELVAAAGGGDVSATGTPLNNEIAVFTNGTTIDSDSTFTWDGSTLAITGNLTLSTDLVVAHGGTGVSTLNDGGVVLGSGAAAVSVVAPVAGAGDAAGDQYLHSPTTGVDAVYQEVMFTKTITVEDPTATEDITIWYTHQAITIREIEAVLVGSATPSVTIEPVHHTDRSTVTGSDNDILTAPEVILDTTTGEGFVSAVFDDPTIPADSFIWLRTTAQSGTVDELSITFR